MKAGRSRDMETAIVMVERNLTREQAEKSAWKRRPAWKKDYRGFTYDPRTGRTALT